MRCWPPTSQSLGGSAERKPSALGECTFLQSRKKKKTLESNLLPLALANGKECKELWELKWLWQERKQL